MSAGFRKYSIRLLGFSLVLAGLHYLLFEYLLDSLEFFTSIWGLYLFLFLLTLAGFWIVLRIHSKLPDKTASVFVAIGFFKMLAAVVFLLPLIQSSSTSMIQQVLTFFVPYFLYLGFDTYHTVGLLRKAS